MYIYIYMYIERERERDVYVCMYVCTYVRTYVCVYIYIYIYIYTYVHRSNQYDCHDVLYYVSLKQTRGKVQSGGDTQKVNKHFCLKATKTPKRNIQFNVYIYIYIYAYTYIHLSLSLYIYIYDVKVYCIMLYLVKQDNGKGPIYGRHTERKQKHV